MAGSHSEAYTLIKKLPEEYQSKVSIEQVSDDDSINLFLNINLSRQHAEKLRAALNTLFPNTRIEPYGE